MRLALGRMITRGERQLTILDDPLTHADSRKHRRMLEILEEVALRAAEGNGSTNVAPLQTLILTCHPERFDHLRSAKQINLAELIARE